MFENRLRDRESLYRWTLRAFALSFAVVGSLFVAAPNATIAFLNRVGSEIGDFAPAPASDLRLWLVLAASYMLLVTLLAWMAQRDLRRNRSLLLLLAAGKGCSSLLALGFYVFDSEAFAYLLNFLVDGSITLAVLAVWAGVPSLAESPAADVLPTRLGPVQRALGPAGARTLHAALDALVPRGGPFEAGAGEARVADAVAEFAEGAKTGHALRALLYVLEVSPFFLPPIWMRPFSRLPVDDRARILEAWENSRLWPRRQALHWLKLLGTSHFYADPEVQRTLGYPHPLVRVPRDAEPARARVGVAS